MPTPPRSPTPAETAAAVDHKPPAAEAGQRWLPPQGRPAQLMVLLHGVGARGADMAPLARWLHGHFPQAAIVAPDAPEPLDGSADLDGGAARQWFSRQGIADVNRLARVEAGLPGLAAWVGAEQQATGVAPAATALIGFSQGAVMALALAQRDDGIAGRVLAFAGRYARLPDQALQHTTLHLFHGGADDVIPVGEARRALERLAEIGADATLDIVDGAGHEIDAAMLDCALHRLRSHIPHRTWAAALGSVPSPVRRPRRDDEDDHED